MRIENEGVGEGKNYYLCGVKNERILKVERPGDYLGYVGAECRHPLVGVVDFGRVSPVRSSLNDYGVYGLFMHSRVRDDLTYGCGVFAGSTGSLICVAPGQIGGREDDGELLNLDGWALLFHPDLLIGTQLEKDIHRFSFFDYSANEALYMDAEEKGVLESLIRSIDDEIKRPRDREQDAIIVSYITALLNFCNRAYGRQFSRIRQTGDDILVRLSAFLNKYYADREQYKYGVPSVQVCAEGMNMSTHYFSDMVKKAVGETAGNFIRSHVMRLAQNRLTATGNVSETAYELGFEYPQHFSRMFKRCFGMTPREYLAKK